MSIPQSKDQRQVDSIENQDSRIAKDSMGKDAMLKTHTVGDNQLLQAFF